MQAVCECPLRRAVLEVRHYGNGHLQGAETSDLDLRGADLSLLAILRSDFVREVLVGVDPLVEEPAQILAALLLANVLEFGQAHPAACEFAQASSMNALKCILAQQAVERADDGEALAVSHNVVVVELDRLLFLLGPVDGRIEPLPHAFDVPGYEFPVLFGAQVFCSAILPVHVDAQPDPEPARILFFHDVSAPVLMADLVGGDPAPMELGPLRHPPHAVDDDDARRKGIPPGRAVHPGDDAQGRVRVKPESFPIEIDNVHGRVDEQFGAFLVLRLVEARDGYTAGIPLQDAAISPQEDAERGSIFEAVTSALGVKPAAGDDGVLLRDGQSDFVVAVTGNAPP